MNVTALKIAEAECRRGLPLGTPGAVSVACVAAAVFALVAAPARADHTTPPVRRPRVTVPAPTPAPVPAPGCALRAGWVYVGRYRCAQGVTELTLRVVEVRGAAVRAEFVFDHPQSGAAGRYFMTGTCAGDALSLDPDRWVVRPANYMMVGMRGTLGPQAASYEGSMTHPSCGGFSVQRR